MNLVGQDTCHTGPIVLGRVTRVFGLGPVWPLALPCSLFHLHMGPDCHLPPSVPLPCCTQTKVLWPLGSLLVASCAADRNRHVQLRRCPYVLIPVRPSLLPCLQQADVRFENPSKVSMNGSSNGVK